MQNKETGNIFSSILKGEFVAEKGNKQFIPLLLLIVLLVLVNIRSSFHAEKLLRQSISLEKEVADLRLVHITTKSDLMRMYRRSVMEEIVNKYGIKTSIMPPEIIEVR